MALSTTYVLPVDPRMGYSILDPAFHRESVDLSSIYIEDASEFPAQSTPSATS